MCNRKYFWMSLFSLVHKFATNVWSTMLHKKFSNPHFNFNRCRPLGQWIARLLPKPRAQARIPVEACMLPCAPQLGIEWLAHWAPLHKLAINVGDPQGQELTAHVPRRWIKKKSTNVKLTFFIV